ncbi:MAG: ArsA-related P-loop ATPase [Deltaproteobacteria bacterium]|nr:ArsA-related P-loop ATPase [Deltaproteobacteria bacterium]
MTLDELFRRRLLVVVGKGGVGKTTVACALALEAARRGRKVLLCEVDGVARAPQLLQARPGPLGQAVQSPAGPWLMAVEGRAALAEYLGMIIPVKRLLQTVFKSQLYQYFVAAAPGLKELMTLGKIWYEAERSDGSGDAWDHVIVDAPATGHGLQYLRMPAAARDTFEIGLVHREAQRIVDLLTDAERTAVNLVTTAEEMPVNETISMYRALRDDLAMPTGLLFVNRVHAAGLAAADAAKLEQAAKAQRDRRARQVLEAVAARARAEIGWSELNARHRARLAAEVPLPTVELPFVFAEEFGFAELQTLREAIVRAPSLAPSRPRAAGKRPAQEGSRA